MRAVRTLASLSSGKEIEEEGWPNARGLLYDDSRPVRWAGGWLRNSERLDWRFATEISARVWHVRERPSLCAQLELAIACHATFLVLAFWLPSLLTSLSVVFVRTEPRESRGLGCLGPDVYCRHHVWGLANS